MIVRGEEALLPRGSTELEVGDRLHILVRGYLVKRVEELFELWREGPIGQEEREYARPIAGRPAIFSVRPWRPTRATPAIRGGQRQPGPAPRAHPPRRARRAGRAARRPLRGQQQRHRRRRQSAADCGSTRYGGSSGRDALGAGLVAGSGWCGGLSSGQDGRFESWPTKSDRWSSRVRPTDPHLPGCDCIACCCSIYGCEAATTLGSDLAQVPGEYVFCDTTCTCVQSALPGRVVAAPTDGVVVRWRISTDIAGGSVRAPRRRARHGESAHEWSTLALRCHRRPEE